MGTLRRSQKPEPLHDQFERLRATYSRISDPRQQATFKAKLDEVARAWEPPVNLPAVADQRGGLAYPGWEW